MNYKKLYLRFIKTRKIIKSKKDSDIYLEEHHIIPKIFFKVHGGCLPGDPDTKKNKILITPEEHFFAHLVLAKCFTNSTLSFQMILAVNFMLGIDKKVKNRRKYGWIKRLHSKNMSKRRKGMNASNTPFMARMAEKKRGSLNPKVSIALKGLMVREKNPNAKKIIRLNDGKIYSHILDICDEYNVKIPSVSQAIKNFTGIGTKNNPNDHKFMKLKEFEKFNSTSDAFAHINKILSRRKIDASKKMSLSRMGRKVTKKTREKLSKSLTGIKRTEEQKDKNALAKVGKLHSEETKKKISEISSNLEHSLKTKKNMSKNTKGKKNPMARKVKDRLTNKIYDTISDTSIKTKIPSYKISLECNNPSKKNRFEFFGDLNFKKFIYLPTGKLYNNIKDAEKATGIDRKKIYGHCNSKNKMRFPEWKYLT